MGNGVQTAPVDLHRVMGDSRASNLEEGERTMGAGRDRYWDGNEEIISDFRVNK